MGYYVFSYHPFSANTLYHPPACFEVLLLLFSAKQRKWCADMHKPQRGRDRQRKRWTRFNLGPVPPHFESNRSRTRSQIELVLEGPIRSGTDPNRSQKAQRLVPRTGPITRTLGIIPVGVLYPKPPQKNWGIIQLSITLPWCVI